MRGQPQTDSVTTVRAHVPEFTRPGFRWNVAEEDEHLWVTIQHDAAGVGRLRCWMSGWLGSVCLHERDESDTVEVQEEFNYLVAALYDAWASAVADIEIGQAAREMAKLDVGLLCATDGEGVRPLASTPSRVLLQAGKARAREMGLTVAALAVTAPLGAHHLCAAVGERSADTYVQVLNRLSLTAANLALRRRRGDRAAVSSPVLGQPLRPLN